MTKIKALFCLFILAFYVGANAQIQNDTTTINILESDSIAKDTIPWDIAIQNGLSLMAEEAEYAPYTVGLCVYDLTDDSLLFAYNADKVLRPASTQKLLTGITALNVLGGEYNYKTKAYYTGNISLRDSTLNGDVYIVGDMDPTLTYDSVCNMAKQLINIGVKTIKGNIYSDISMKDSLLYGKGWCWDDVPSKYEPYLTALLFDRGQNSPASTRYSKNPYFRPWLHFTKTFGDILLENGVVALNEKGDTLESINYGVKNLPIKTSYHNFYTCKTPIDSILKRVMKNSDNLYAESIFFHIAKFNKKKNCTYKDAIRHIENTLRKAGCSLTDIEIADGSGVSLYNYHTASTQVGMLRYAYLNENIFKHLYPALPVSGEDGTLSDRMKTGATQYNVHAKTGTVKGVSSLAGYVDASNGHILAFSIIINGVLKNKNGHIYQDRVCEILAK